MFSQSPRAGVILDMVAHRSVLAALARAGEGRTLGKVIIGVT